MTRFLGILIAITWLTAWAGDEPYDYPFADAFLATVAGTPEACRAILPESIPLKSAAITVFPDRVVPDYLWHEAKLRYSYALQKKAAPLVFLIAGTGGSYTGQKNETMARAFYQAGFHVVSLSSPTFPNFVVAASKTSVPGHATRDAEDLYRVMELIWTSLKQETEITDFFIAGYSLGGFNAAYVTWLDEQRRVFNFKKVLLINPPVRLYSSISLLDRMLENIPGGIDNFAQYYSNIVTKFSAVYTRADQLVFNEDFLFHVYSELQPKDEELAALIGLSFRFSSAHLAFTSDLMTDFGYIKPMNVHLTRNSSTADYGQVAYRLGFTDYFHEYFFPFYKALTPSITREQLIEEMSLIPIEDYLHSTRKIEVMHNADDPILEPGEIDFFPRVFGTHAKIYPKGGHCGNLEYRDNVAHMINVFKQ